MGSISLYFHTVKNLKPSQVINRLKIKMGKGCSLGVATNKNRTNIQKVKTSEILDFDPVFMARFEVKELMEDTISILHSSKKMDWKRSWKFDDKSALWNFNLHYFEYLFPLVLAWRDTKNKQYLDKTIQIIEGWIDANPVGESPAWSSYPTALRIVSWISYFSYVGDNLEDGFKEKFLDSLHDQYVYLSEHLEKDILGNHLFENLKSLVLSAVFFKDKAVFNKALMGFRAECKEEILSDGMHFELSPMYHKIIFEGILRMAMALRNVDRRDLEIESYIQPMLDVAYSFENELERVPLFNDGGNNVAKSLAALIKTAEELGYIPHFKGQLKASGFYIFQKCINDHKWKLIVDAGQPGPKYIPGHAHCDAMSYELFRDGKPVVVNCGTYAYQGKERGFFRSTAAHNTIMIEETEQSQCWGDFRLAKKSNTKVLNVTDDSIVMEMTDQKGQKGKRMISFSDTCLHITDEAKNKHLSSFIHLVMPMIVSHTGKETTVEQPYSPDYGIKECIKVKKVTADNMIKLTISLEN